jgi:predicted SnoaL-like aldol condensation-catalyzing enzyme
MLARKTDFDQSRWRIEMQYNPVANKQSAIEFYRMAYLGEPARAVELYVGAEHIQHNPLVGDGKQAFIDYFTEMANQYPNKEIEFVRTVAEGNLVALHTHQTWPGNEEYATMDFFRFDENGKIVEHWDSIQKIPDETKNNNLMY